MQLNLNYSLKIVENNKQITELILEALLPTLKSKLNKVRSVLDYELKEVFHDGITRSAEYKSLKGEKNIPGGESLMGHFGFDDQGDKVDAIINRWTSSIHSEMFLQRTGTKLNAGVQVYLINKAYTDVLGMIEAVQETNKSAKIGPIRVPAAYITLIPWLRFLLFEGDKSLIEEYMITFDLRGNTTSRSGQALMLKARGKRWFVPGVFAGTENDNWVTRVLQNEVYPKLEGTIKNTLVKLFN